MKIKSAFAALAASAFLAGGAWAQTIGIGTGPQGSLTYNTGAAVAKVASDLLGMQALVQPYSGNQQHIPLVTSGRLQFGVNNVQETIAAANGTAQFEGQPPNEEFRVVARLFPIPVGFMVRADSDITAIEQLRGKRVPVGYSSQATVAFVNTALLAAGGLTEADVDGVPVPNTSRGTGAFTAGQADAAASSLGGARLSKADAAVGGIRILPIPEGGAERIAAVNPAYYVITMQPREGMPGIEGPTPTLAYDFLLNASTNTPDDVVYEIVKAMAENKDLLVSVSGAYRGFAKETMASQYEGVEYHPGAVRYYKEAGLWPSGS